MGLFESKCHRGLVAHPPKAESLKPSVAAIRKEQVKETAR
jgi:hypothetical protein